MIDHRPWLPLFVAGCLFTAAAEAQDNAGGGGGSAAGGGSSAGSAAGGGAAGGAAPGGASPGTTPASSPSSTQGASSAFGAAPSSPSSPSLPSTPNQGATPFGTQPLPGQNQGNQSNAPGELPTPDNTTPGGSSAFGNAEKPGGAAQLQPAPASFTVPGFYGRGPQTFTVGEGRLARPKFRFTGNIAVGYDDNVFQTPTHGPSAPAQKVQVLETPGSPAQSAQVLVPSGDPNVPDTITNVTLPAVAPKFRTVTIPAVPESPRIDSFITRTDAKMDIQLASRRTLFTFDLGGGVDYYWNRPGKKEDYTGELSMIYLHKLSGRAQFTFAVNASYQSQPDFSQPNTPTSNNVGSYLSANLKADFSYRLTPRFSAVVSVSYDTLQYEETTQQTNNFGNTTFGTELRYLFSPRLTLLGELRYSSDMHQNSDALNTTNYYALIGGELTLSRRFTATLRFGEEVQTFEQSGGKNSSPYFEGSLNYRLAQGTIVGWNVRYGYEESGAVNARNLVARTGLQVTQIFTPRLQSVLNVNLIRSDFTQNSDVPDTTTDPVTGVTTSTGTHSVTTDQIQDTIDASLGFYYTLNRHWSLNLTYSYTMQMGPETTFDYYRQRVFFGAAYQF